MASSGVKSPDGFWSWPFLDFSHCCSMFTVTVRKSKNGRLQKPSEILHQMKPCQVDWWKLVIQEKIQSVKEKSSCQKLSIGFKPKGDNNICHIQHPKKKVGCFIIDVNCLLFLIRSFDGIGPGRDVIVHSMWYRCYCTSSYVMFIIYFFFNSGIENSSLSQMWGRLYFPIFLLRVGLFTLIYMDSLMVLARLLSSLPVILKLTRVVTWPQLF